jgi:7-cyano-7-deazaguanine synthase
MAKKAVILLSGGLDSATVLAIARSRGFDCHALSFRYGQRHEAEIEAAKAVAQAQGMVSHTIMEIDLGAFGGSAMTGDMEVPKGRGMEEISFAASGIPVTYVPARNTIFLSFALAWAETLDARDIFIGVNALDYSGYPDCRPEYIAAFQNMANLATKAGVEAASGGGGGITIHTPLIEMTKAEIISMGAKLEVEYGLTLSCYDPLSDGRSCGGCDACLLRLKGFAEAGLSDPIAYAQRGGG